MYQIVQKNFLPKNVFKSSFFFAAMHKKKKDLMSALTLKAIPLYQCLKEILKKVQKLLVGLEHKELQNQIG